MMNNFDTRKSLRRYQIAGFLSMLVMGGVLGGWSALANIHGAVIAPATVAVESFSKKIQHKEGGIIAAIRVKDGDEVKVGQELVLLDDTDTKAELGIVQGLLREFLTKQARLEAERDGAEAIEFPPEILAAQGDAEVAHIISGQEKLFRSNRAAFKGKQDQLQQQVEQMNEQIDGLVSQQKSKEQQIKLIDSELVNLKKLQKQGLVPVSRVLAMERERARLDGERGALVAQKAEAESKIGEIKIALIQDQDAYRSQVLTELREAESKIAELTERRVAAQSRLSRTSIKAPEDGTVYQVMVHTIGGVIAPGEAVMLMVPEGDELVLQAQISTQDVDNVHVGQKAIVRFPALRSRFTPEIDAEVIHVAADVSRIDQNTPPFYAVRLKLVPHALDKLEPGQKLKPGMPAEAFIRTDERTPLSYLLKPLADQLAHAFREK
jgi:HlyD family secretion protein